MKMLIKHLVHLQRRGHWVMAAFRGAPGSPVLPPWASQMLTPDEERLLLPHETMAAALSDVDVVMVGYFTQLLELGDATACPGAIVYWDQGHEHIFGDPTAHPEWDRVFHKSMHLPIALLSVSNIVRDILAHHFSRVAPVVPNAIDTALFHPGPDPAPHPHRVAGRFPVNPDGPRRVLIVGNPGLRLKNFETALAVLSRAHTWLLEEAARQGFSTPAEASAAAAAEASVLRKSAPPASPKHHPDVRVASPAGLHVTWMCQARPAALPVGLPLDLVVNPPQEALPGIYRSGFDCLLFCSAYEAWGMPVIEAMASGVPVVCSRCHGVDMFSSHRYNCLSADAFDVQGLARCVFAMLTRPALQATFARRARGMACRTTWEAAMGALETALYHVDRCVGRGEASGAGAGRPVAPASAVPVPPSAAAPTGGPGAGSPQEAREAAVAASKVLSPQSVETLGIGSKRVGGGAGRHAAAAAALSSSSSSAGSAAAAAGSGVPGSAHFDPSAVASAAGASPGQGESLGAAAAAAARSAGRAVAAFGGGAFGGPAMGGGGGFAGLGGFSAGGGFAAATTPLTSAAPFAIGPGGSSFPAADAASAGPFPPGRAHGGALDPALQAVITRARALIRTPQGARVVATVASRPTLSTEPTVPPELFGAAAVSSSAAPHTGGPPHTRAGSAAVGSACHDVGGLYHPGASAAASPVHPGVVWPSHAPAFSQAAPYGFGSHGYVAGSHGFGHGGGRSGMG